MKCDDSFFGAQSDRMDRLVARALDDSDAEEPISPTTSLGMVLEQPGSQIDRYRLLQVLGEGGMGVVYLAEQQEPVKREVALKIIKPGMDSKRVIARFEAEQQALALMDHPHVAQVYDAGLAPSGRPYFVMEYVKGIPVTEHCDKYKLTIEERLRLFLHVCEAIRHAHQKGIIHRDLKPSNILVTIEGNEAIPKVIDFGVARAISQPLTERTLYTEQGQLVGTPEYMSPEQVEMSNQDIDTRADIYSLGVVLYELIAGVLPFDPQTLREGGLDHIRKVICEEDPKTPSTRLSRTSVQESAEAARCRRTSTKALQRKLHGDLDWITLKAMEKDRTRRYDSAGELAADIVRHLNDEPVTAGPPSTLYRMRKYVRRHRPLVTGSAAVLVVLLAGIAGIVVFAVKADRQARTVQAVADFLNKDLLGSVALQQAMSEQVTVHSILDTASAQLEGKFANEPLVEASIRQTLGQTYIELGDYRQAEPHLKRAYDLRRRQLGDKAPLTLTSLGQLGRVYLLQAHYKEAEPLLVQSLESRRRVLGPDHADTLEASVWLGLVYAELLEVGLAERAEKLLTTAFELGSHLLGKKDPITLEAMYGLAYLRGAVQGRLDEAAPLCLEGWETTRNVLGEGHRLAVQFMVLAAWFEAWSGQSEEAQHHAQTALEMNQRVLGKEHPDTLLAMATLGMVCAIRNDLEQAESLLTESLPLLRSSLGEAHGNKLFFTQWLARAYMCQGRYQEAEQLLVKMIEDGRPSFGDDSLLMMEGRRNMMWLYAMQERNDDLKTWCSKEIEKLHGEPGQTNLAAAAILNGLAWLQAAYISPLVCDGPGAIKHATEACELTNWKDAGVIETLAAAHAETGDFAGAVKWQERAMQVFAQQNPAPRQLSDADCRLRLYKSGRPQRFCVFLWDDPHVQLGRKEWKEYEKTERNWTKAVATSRRYLGESHPETRGCILAMVQLYEAWGKPEQAEKWRSQLPPESQPPKQ